MAVCCCDERNEMIIFYLGFMERVSLYALIAEFAMFVRFEEQSQGLPTFIALVIYVFCGSLKDSLVTK